MFIPLSVDLVCTTGDVRLVGGSNPLEGRVEVCFFNQWGTICDTMWGTEEAEVACQQLGYTGACKEQHYTIEITTVLYKNYCLCYFSQPLRSLVPSLAREMVPLWQTALCALVMREDLVTVCITSTTAVPMPTMLV